MERIEARSGSADAEKEDTKSKDAAQIGSGPSAEIGIFVHQRKEEVIHMPYGSIQFI